MRYPKPKFRDIEKLQKRFSREMARLNKQTTESEIREKYQKLYLFAEDDNLFRQDLSDLTHEIIAAFSLCLSKTVHQIKPKMTQYWMCPTRVEGFGEINEFTAESDEVALKIASVVAMKRKGFWKLHRGAHLVGVVPKIVFPVEGEQAVGCGQN